MSPQVRFKKCHLSFASVQTRFDDNFIAMDELTLIGILSMVYGGKIRMAKYAMPMEYNGNGFCFIFIKILERFLKEMTSLLGPDPFND